MQMKNTVTIKMSIKEAEALRLIAYNGWGDGEFSGYGGQNPKTQQKALDKLRKATNLYYQKKP